MRALAVVGLFAATLCSAEPAASAQGIVAQQPTPATGAAVQLPGSSFEHGIGANIFFSLTADAQIQSVSFDPSEGGVQELFVEFFYGCKEGASAPVTPAGTQCNVEYGLTPMYAGARSGTLRVVTSTGTYTLGVAFSVSGPQPAFTPGTISSIPLSGNGSSRSALALDGAGNLFVADASAFEVERVDAVTGKATIVAGDGAYGDTGDGGPATSAALGPVFSLGVSPAGDIYVVSNDSASASLDAVRKVLGSNGTISTVTAIYTTGHYGSVVVDAAGNIYTSSPDNGSIVKLTPQNTQVYLVDTGTGQNPGFCTYPHPIVPTTMVLDGNGNLYFVSNSDSVYKVSTGATSNCPALTLVAGTGTSGYSGDGGAATSATFGAITGLAIDAAGDVYIADATNNVIRRVDATTGLVSTIAGTGTAGDSGDGGPATAATLRGMGGALESLAIDPLGNLYVLDGQDNVVRKIDVTAPTLDFPATDEGSTSADEALIVSNIGNAPLVFTTPTGGTNPAITAPFNLDGGTCPVEPGSSSNSLAGGVSCTQNVSFTPVSSGAVSGTLTYSDNVGTADPSTGYGNQVVTLNGTGNSNGPLPDAFVSPSVVGFGGVQIGTTSAAWTVALTNLSGNALTIQSITVSNPMFHFVSGCGAKLAGYSSCNVTVTFQPTAGGQTTGTMTINADALHGPPTVALSGYGDGNQAAVSPSNISFGSFPAGSSSSAWTVLITNSTAIPLNITSMILTDPIDFTMVDNCGSTLPGNSSCTVNIAFAPQGVDYYSGQLIIDDSANPTGQIVTMSGTGTQPNATVQVSPTNISFGTLSPGTIGAPTTVTVSNTGSAPLYIGSWVLSDTNNFRLNGNCPATLAANTSCQLQVSFTPTNIGSYNGTLTITDSAIPSTQVVTLSGTGALDRPQAFVSPDNIGFGSVLVGTTANAWTVTLNNTTAVPLQITGVVISNSVFAANRNCGATLAAYSTCEFYVTFSPTSIGQVNGTITIHDNTLAGTEVITVSGYGQSAGTTVMLAPGSVNFSSQTVGTQGNPWTATFNNMGGTPINISSIKVSDTKNFSQTNYCGSTLAAYSNCNILIYFNPQQQGTLNANLTVVSSGNPGTISIPLNGTATPPSMGSYVVTSGTPEMTLAAGQSGQTTFTFSPTGGFVGSVILGCAGLPTGASCKFTPATLTANGSNTPQTSQLTVTTSGIGSGMMASNHTNGSTTMAAVLGLNSLMLGCLITRRKKFSRRMQALVTLLLLSGLAGVVGCGVTTGSLSTAAGNNAVKVTATGLTTSGVVTQNANFTLTITQ